MEEGLYPMPRLAERPLLLFADHFKGRGILEEESLFLLLHRNFSLNVNCWSAECNYEDF